MRNTHFAYTIKTTTTQVNVDTHNGCKTFQRVLWLLQTPFITIITAFMLTTHTYTHTYLSHIPVTTVNISPRLIHTHTDSSISTEIYHIRSPTKCSESNAKRVWNECVRWWDGNFRKRHVVLCSPADLSLLSILFHSFLLSFLSVTFSLVLHCLSSYSICH